MPPPKAQGTTWSKGGKCKSRKAEGGEVLFCGYHIGIVVYVRHQAIGQKTKGMNVEQGNARGWDG